MCDSLIQPEFTYRAYNTHRMKHSARQDDKQYTIVTVIHPAKGLASIINELIFSSIEDPIPKLFRRPSEATITRDH